MPKQKTHRGSTKRFKHCRWWRMKRSQAFTSHRFHGKTKSNVVTCVNKQWFALLTSNVLNNN